MKSREENKIIKRLEKTKKNNAMDRTHDWKSFKNINKALRAYVIAVGKGKHLGWGATA